MRKILVLALLAGCGSSLKDDRHPTGSSSVAANQRYDAVLAVNVDEGTVTRVDRSTSAISEVAVGLEPTRIAKVGRNEYWVTLRGERAIAVIEESGDQLLLSELLPAGVEPHGIVASENGKRVYVANSLSDEVAEYNGNSRELLRTFAVQDEPRWLALHPNGRVLFVGSTRDGSVNWIDLKSGEVHPIDLPPATRRGEDGEDVGLDPRVTGDLTVRADGGELAVPTIYADTTTSVDTSDDPERPVVNGYGSDAGLGVSRLNPVLVTIPLDGEGHPSGEKEAVFLAAFGTSADERSLETMPIVRSYPSSVTASPDSERYVVTLEGSNAVLVIDADPATDVDGFGSSTAPGVSSDTGGGGGEFMPFTSTGQAGFAERTSVIITTAAGPRGVAFLSQQDAQVHSFLDRAVEDLGFENASEELQDREGNFGSVLLGARGYVRMTEPSLPTDVEEGRRMFYSAIDARMAGSGAGVSCATCHFDGRNDGMTWTLEGEPRQTVSLAGDVPATAPVTWGDEVASVSDEAMITSELRMGGGGLDPSDAAKIEAYVASTRYPDAPRAGSKSPLVTLGAELFARADVACATCHSGDLFTDSQSHVVIDGLNAQTPTLRGIAASAPYFHDGSAPDLGAVVRMARSGGMGNTGALDDREIDALVAYLESL